MSPLYLNPDNLEPTHVGCYVTKMMSDTVSTKSVERLFPFVVKSRAFIVGRDILARSKSNLHFILVTTDISENSRDQILRDYTHYPVVQCYTEADLEKFFAVKGTKVLGFTKSGLAQSIYAELKPHRINKPVESKRSQQPDLKPRMDTNSNE